MDDNKTNKGTVKSALMAVGGLVLAWAAVEIACKPYLNKGRDDLGKSLDPNYDPDDDQLHDVHNHTSDSDEPPQSASASKSS